MGLSTHNLTTQDSYSLYNVTIIIYHCYGLIPQHSLTYDKNRDPQGSGLEYVNSILVCVARGDLNGGDPSE
jgi:hypothetical protein